MAERPISIVSPKFVDFTEASWSLGGGSHAPRGKEQIIEGLISASISTDNLGDLTSWYYLNGNPGNDLLEQIDEAILSLLPGQVMLPSTAAGIALQVGTDDADSVGYSRPSNFLIAGNGDDVVRGGNDNWVEARRRVA